METFMLACPSVATVLGSEVRFSIADPVKVRPILDWPVAHISCGEIIPDQLRTQWGVSTAGARLDSYHGLQFGNARNNLTLGFRSTSTSANNPLGPVAGQRVGVASLTIGGRVRFKYWNDHNFWWWPMADGGDQGDTAGLQFSYNLGAHQAGLGAWKFQNVAVTLRLASGIPNRLSARQMGDGQVYTDVQFSEIDRGDLDVSTTLTNRRRQQLDVGITVNSGALRHAVQSDLVHKNLNIPEFPQTKRVEVMMYMRLTNWP